MTERLQEWAKKERMRRDWILHDIMTSYKSLSRSTNSSVKHSRYCGTEEENTILKNIVEDSSYFWDIWNWIKKKYPDLQLKVSKYLRTCSYGGINSKVIYLNRYSGWVLLHELRHYLQDTEMCLGYDRVKFDEISNNRIQSSKNIILKKKEIDARDSEYDRVAERDSEMYASKMLYTLGHITCEELELATRLIEERFKDFSRSPLRNIFIYYEEYSKLFTRKRRQLMSIAEEKLVQEMIIDNYSKDDIIYKCNKRRVKYGCPFGYDMPISTLDVYKFVKKYLA